MNNEKKFFLLAFVIISIGTLHTTAVDGAEPAVTTTRTPTRTTKTTTITRTTKTVTSSKLYRRPFGFNATAVTPSSAASTLRQVTIYLRPKTNKFPVSSPRVRFPKMITTTTSTTTETPTTNPPTPVMIPVMIPKDDNTLKHSDILELSSTEDKLSLVSWPIPRRPNNRRFRPPSPTSTTRSPLAKLRRPRPTRPAMYSLDGFVPKPSLKFRPTTEAPADVLARKMDLQALGSVTKRRKVKFVNDATEDDGRRYKIREGAPLRRKPAISRYAPLYRQGVLGVDFPAYDIIPKTSFDCADRGGAAGMFADPEARCQVWHLCPGGATHHRHSFLCPNGTIFNERKGICDWWYNVEC